MALASKFFSRGMMLGSVIAVLAGSTIYFAMNRYPDAPPAPIATIDLSQPEIAKDQQQLSTIKDNDRLRQQLDALSARLDALTAKNENLENHIVNLSEQGNTAAVSQEPDSANFDQESDVEPTLEQEDAIHNAYLDSIESLYEQQTVDVNWANNLETTALEKLSTGSGASSAMAESITGISLETFSCRSQLCRTEFIADSIDQLITYQNFMIKEMALDLPTIVFGPAEAFGNKYRMRVMLANENYEFPAMPNL